MRRITLLMGVLILAACNKVPVITPWPDAQLSFYNASFTLQQQLTSYSTKAMILLDTSDLHFAPDKSLDAFAMPYFSTGSVKLQYPNTGYNATQITPWTMYMHLAPGDHNFTLLDTGHAILLPTDHISLSGMPATVFFTDSLGSFRTLTTRNEKLVTDSAVRIRFIHLSPDAGRVSVGINGQAFSAFSDMYFMNATDYKIIPCTHIDTLRIRLYGKGATGDVLARAYLEIMPGHTYTLLLQGYKAAGRQYIVPNSGANIKTIANLQLLTYKNY